MREVCELCGLQHPDPVRIPACCQRRPDPGPRPDTGNKFLGFILWLLSVFGVLSRLDVPVPHF